MHYRRFALCVLSLAAALPLSACASSSGSNHTQKTVGAASTAETADNLSTLVQLYAQRLMTADKVAAAKWGTGKPIDDPAREKQVLDAMTARAKSLGIDQQVVERIFRDQIEANKVVQRGLYREWERHPSQRPTTRPDLVKEVRPELDRIGADLLQAIQAAQPRIAASQCAALTARAMNKITSAMYLDALHQQGLQRAVSRTCSKPNESPNATPSH
jgi:chorismate mutase